MKMMSKEKIHEEATELLELLKDDVKFFALFGGMLAFIPLAGAIVLLAHERALFVVPLLAALLVFFSFFYAAFKPYSMARKSVKNRTYVYECLDIDGYYSGQYNIIALYRYNGSTYKVSLGTTKITEDTLRPKKVHVFDFGNPEKGKSFVEAFIDNEEEA